MLMIGILRPSTVLSMMRGAERSALVDDCRRRSRDKTSRLGVEVGAEIVIESVKREA